MLREAVRLVPPSFSIVSPLQRLTRNERRVCITLHYTIAFRNARAAFDRAGVQGYHQGSPMQGIAVAETRKPTKTENISLRLDPKTKFILDFVVRLKGVRTTDLIARAIKEMADSTTVGSDFEERNWLDYWHPEEGIRTLNLIFDKRIPTTFDEDELAEFVRQHWQFFFDSRNLTDPTVVFVQVLWPNIETYLDHWRLNKSADRWATGNLMLKAIKDAGMKGPNWPPQTAAPPLPKTPAKNDLDDEIPF